MSTHQKISMLHLISKLKKLSNFDYGVMALTWTILTLYLSLVPAKKMPNLNIWDIVGIDKAGHLVFYIIFSFLWLMAFRSREKLKIIVLIFSVSFGILMEICQFYLFNGRSFEYYDILANIIGSLIGVILFKKCIN